MSPWINLASLGDINISAHITSKLDELIYFFYIKNCSVI